ncbi:hypothetical protein LLG95_11590 [bacterium]|nr:hypothetical protein [bacterium]
MKFPKSLVIEIVSILILTAMLFAWAWFNSSRREPVGQRSGWRQKEWDEAHAQPVAAVPFNPGVMKTINVVTSPTKIVINFNAPQDAPPNSYEYQMHRMRPDEELEIDGVRLKLNTIDVEVRDATTHLNTRSTYTPAMRLVSVATSTLPRYYFEYAFPTLRLDFSVTKSLSTPDVKLVKMIFFDAETHQAIGSGGRSRLGRKSNLRARGPCALLCKRPVEVMLEIASGPVETFTFPAKQGAGFTSDSLSMYVAAVLPSSSSSQSAWTDYQGYNSQIKKSHYEYSSFTGKDRELVLHVWPQYQFWAVDFEGVDANGKTVRGGDKGAMNGLCKLQFGGTGPIETIKVTRQARRHRIFMELPQIPGIDTPPPRNLLDVKIPYVYFTQAYEMENFLRAALQLSVWSSSGNPKPANAIKASDFPMEFKNTTVREIAESYARGGRFEIDRPKGSFVVEYPKPLAQRWKEFWRRF